MAADVAQKIRVVAFGMALCFLAALFSIEAKTTWAVVGDHASVGIASAKALAIDRSQLHSAGLHIAHSAADNLLLNSGIDAVLAVGLLAIFPLRLQSAIAVLCVARHGCRPPSHFQRPPPSR